MSYIRKKIIEEVSVIENVEELKKFQAVRSALIGLQFEGGHTHIHYPPGENADDLKQMVARILEQRPRSAPIIRRAVKVIQPTESTSTDTKERNLVLPAPQIEPTDTEERKIIFRHRRALGDGLMFTAGVRDFKLLFPEISINVNSNFPALWENNPYLDRSLKKGDPGVEYYRVGYPIVGYANGSPLHFSLGFLLDMIGIAGAVKPLPISLSEFTAAFSNGRIGDPDMGNEKKNPEAPEIYRLIKDKYDGICKTFARQRADIYLTDEEKSYNMVQDVYGAEKYWLIAPGGKSDCTCKVWDWRRFQDVIDHFSGRIKFVVIGKSDHIVEKLDNVIDLTDKFNEDIRGLLPLAYHAEGCIGGVTFLMHLAAAMPSKIKNERKPCVVIFGGREPTTFTGYTGQQFLHTNAAFSCCEHGGCWHSRVVELSDGKDGNKRLCRQPISVDGRMIPGCMDTITSQDVIRAVDKYYEGDIYAHEKTPVVSVELIDPEPQKLNRRDNASAVPRIEFVYRNEKEINVLASLNTKGGGEQSACMIVQLLREAGWTVHFHPWDKVYEAYSDKGVSEHSFKRGMSEHMVQGIPLLFYANDQINPFVAEGMEVVEKSSKVIVGINYVNGDLPKSRWIAQTGKLKAVIFQNEEKRGEFERDRLGFEDAKQIVLFGAINLNSFLEVQTSKREDEKELVILKHCTPDYRKYTTEQSVGKGQKIHLWQKNIIKETDVKFYTRLLKDVKDVRFEFMEAHKELVAAFEDDSRMVFHKWNAMSVEEFLSKGHLYLYRTSNLWRDNYPRVVAEALAAGLPVLSEPRDGTKDRIVHGNTGFYCIDYDAFKYGVKLLRRKEKYRVEMGKAAKAWAKRNLDPREWVSTLEGLLW